MMMYQQVHEHAAQGESHNHIARSLHLTRRTVRKYLRMPTFEAHYRSPHRSGIEAYRAYLQERWQQGEVRAKHLWQEIQAQGFGGCYSTVWAFVRDWPYPEERASTASAPGPRAPHRSPPTTRTPRQAMWLLLRPQEQLKEADAAYRDAMVRLCPALEELSWLGQEFGRLVHERQPEGLLPWLERAKACPYEEVQRFALGLVSEFAAGQAALTEPWSTGQVEGQITRLKLLKRQMYGRAKIDLLRLRVLPSA
jgi:transposase